MIASFSAGDVTFRSMSVMRISRSTLGRLISVRLTSDTCWSRLGCTASPERSGRRIDCVSTWTLAVASYISGIRRTTTAAIRPTSQAAATPTHRRRQMPRRWEISWDSSSSMARPSAARTSSAE